MEIPVKTATITIKVEPELKALLKRAALAERQRLGAWVRGVATKRAESVLRREENRA